MYELVQRGSSWKEKIYEMLQKRRRAVREHTPVAKRPGGELRVQDEAWAARGVPGPLQPAQPLAKRRRESPAVERGEETPEVGHPESQLHSSSLTGGREKKKGRERAADEAGGNLAAVAGHTQQGRTETPRKASQGSRQPGETARGVEERLEPQRGGER